MLQTNNADGPATQSDFAIVTITYSGDLALFKDLCASIDRHMPEITHHVIVDRAERQFFEPFAQGRRRVHVAEDLFQRAWSIRLFKRPYWFLPFTPPIRGWIWQQLIKIAFAAQAEEQALVMTDSDGIFVRPLRREQLIHNGKVRLYRSANGVHASQHARWRQIACRVLGLPISDHKGADYISNIVVWAPAIVREMQARIRKVTHLPWYLSLCWNLRFSEYQLYGIFCQFAEGQHKNMLFLNNVDLCHCSWHYRLDESDLEDFYADFSAEHVAVLIQSNLDLPAETRGKILARLAAS
jgi:hypothetical protein